jgi:hypothetical protein
LRTFSIARFSAGDVGHVAMFVVQCRLRADVGLKLLRGLVGDIEEADLDSLAREATHDRLADAHRAAGDQHHTVLQARVDCAVHLPDHPLARFPIGRAKLAQRRQRPSEKRATYMRYGSFRLATTFKKNAGLHSGAASTRDRPA